MLELTLTLSFDFFSSFYLYALFWIKSSTLSPIYWMYLWLYQMCCKFSRYIFQFQNFRLVFLKYNLLSFLFSIICSSLMIFSVSFYLLEQRKFLFLLFDNFITWSLLGSVCVAYSADWHPYRSVFLCSWISLIMDGFFLFICGNKLSLRLYHHVPIRFFICFYYVPVDTAI